MRTLPKIVIPFVVVVVVTIQFLKCVHTLLTYRLNILRNKWHGNIAQQYKDLLMEKIYSNSKQMPLIVQKRQCGFMYFRFAGWVASHASFISFKQNIITGARRDLSRCQQFTALRDESEALIPTEKFAFDLGLFLLRGKPTLPFFVTSNRCIRVKSTLDWSTVTFCACGLIRLLSVVFCAVRAVYKFEFRIVINETFETRCLERGLLENYFHSFLTSKPDVAEGSA